jgi:hypothetical protein
MERASSGRPVGRHMAKENQQWMHLEFTQEALVMFQGPHCYVSRTLYESDFAVFTSTPLRRGAAWRQPDQTLQAVPCRRRTGTGFGRADHRSLRQLRLHAGVP